MQDAMLIKVVTTNGGQPPAKCEGQLQGPDRPAPPAIVLSIPLWASNRLWQTLRPGESPVVITVLVALLCAGGISTSGAHGSPTAKQQSLGRACADGTGGLQLPVQAASRC